ncbi:MAG: hypothetical protein H7Z43_06095 [Clostridia bacterium]|nr:hypothetical protein [Deltaproteobacteria bacterium]
MSDDDEKKAEARYAYDLVRGKAAKGELAVLTRARVGLLHEELVALPLWSAIEEYIPADDQAQLTDKLTNWSDIIGLDLEGDPALIPVAATDAGVTYAYCHPRLHAEGGPTLVIPPGLLTGEYRSTTSSDEEDILCRALGGASDIEALRALETLYSQRGWILLQFSAQARRLALQIRDEAKAVRAELYARYSGHGER